jgi:hypothetical protein
VSRRSSRDDGQISVLILGYALIVLLVVFTGVAATAVHLARHRLSSIADGAALDAANALDRQRFYAVVGGAGPSPDRVVSLTSASVRDSVAAYLSDRPADGSNGGSNDPDHTITIAAPTGSPDGSTAEVTLAQRVSVPFLAALFGGNADGITVQVTARARARQLP